MKKDDESNDIVFDRDVSQPDTKLKKRKRKKKVDNQDKTNEITSAQNGANNDINNNLVKSNGDKAPDKMRNQEENSKDKEKVKTASDEKNIGKANNSLRVCEKNNKEKNDLVQDSCSLSNSKTDQNNNNTKDNINADNTKETTNEKGKIRKQNTQDDTASNNNNNHTAIENNGDSNRSKKDKNESKNNLNDYILPKTQIDNSEGKNAKDGNDEKNGKKRNSNATGNNWNQENTNNELNNLKNSELIELNKDLSKWNESNLIEIKFWKKELQGRDDKIRVLIEKYNYQKQSLEKLSKEVDKKIEDINLNRLQKGKVDDSDTKKKEKRKTNEQERSNSWAWLDILSKDNARWQGLLDTYGEYNTKLELLDWSKARNDENQRLKHELNWQKRELCEHKQCSKKISELQKSIATYKNDVKRYQNENMQLKAKIELLLKNHSITSHEALVNSHSVHHFKNKTIDYSNEPSTLNKSIKLPMNTFRNNSNANLSSSNNNNNNNKNTKNIALILSAKHNTRTKTMSKWVPLDNKTVSAIRNDKKVHVLSEEERKMICEMFNDNTKYDAFIKKIIIWENYKVSEESKHKSEWKMYQEKVDDWTEQIEYLNWKNKENESRLRIFQNQVNEFKNGKRIYQKKLNDLEGIIANYKITVKEKAQEVNLLMHKLEELQGVVNNWDKKDAINEGNEEQSVLKSGEGNEE